MAALEVHGSSNDLSNYDSQSDHENVQISVIAVLEVSPDNKQKDSSREVNDLPNVADEVGFNEELLDLIFVNAITRLLKLKLVPVLRVVFHVLGPEFGKLIKEPAFNHREEHH